MRKFLSAILIITLIFTMATTVSADKPEPLSVDKNQETVITELTEEEYITIVSESSGLSAEKVKKKLIEYKEKAAKKSAYAQADRALAATSLQYFRAITTKNFSSGTAFYSPIELGMAYTVYNSGGFRQINSIDSVWTGATGSGLYTWSEFSKYTYPNSFPTARIEAHARGAVETQIDVSIAGNAEIKQQLIGCGFSVSLQVGTVYYLRKADFIDLYVNLY